MGKRGGNRDFRQSRDGSDDFGEVGESADIARNQPQHYPFAQNPQCALQRRFIDERKAVEQRAHFASRERLGAVHLCYKPRFGIKQMTDITAIAAGGIQCRVSRSTGPGVIQFHEINRLE